MLHDYYKRTDAHLPFQIIKVWQGIGALKSLGLPRDIKLINAAGQATRSNFRADADQEGGLTR
jgi:hypothetical protein